MYELTVIPFQGFRVHWGESLAERLDTLTAPAPCPPGAEPAAPALIALKVFFFFFITL